MKVVGLTGGMGAGKSTVARCLAAHGAHVVDADQVAREVVEPGMPALAAIVAEFGDEVLTPEGVLDRAAMAGIVFSDQERLRALEEITHPAIRARITELLLEHLAAEAAEPTQRVVVLDHPLLIESGLADDLEVVVVVTAPVDLRVQRLAQGRGIDPDDARARIRAQADDEIRLAVATHVVRNDGAEDDLRDRVVALWQELTDPASG